MNSSLYLHCATPFFAEGTKCFRFSGDGFIWLSVANLIALPDHLLKGLSGYCWQQQDFSEAEWVGVWDSGLTGLGNNWSIFRTLGSLEIASVAVNLLKKTT
jgi:hypothetical protein